MTSPAGAEADGWVDLPLLDGFYVYALYGAADAETPLYIGQSTNVLTRIGGHLGRVDKRAHVGRITVLRCASRDDMDATEQRLIATLRPPWNRAGVPVEHADVVPLDAHLAELSGDELRRAASGAGPSARRGLAGGRTVQRLRAEQGWSCTELARRSGVTDRTISRIEKGQVQANAVTAYRLATALGVTVEQLSKAGAA